jgi:hypothetical protein
MDLLDISVMDCFVRRSAFHILQGIFCARGYVLREQALPIDMDFHHVTTSSNFNRIQAYRDQDGPIDRLFTLCELVGLPPPAVALIEPFRAGPTDAARLKEFIAGKKQLRHA